jgi:hypothetical protein
MTVNILPTTGQLCPDDITLEFKTEFGRDIRYYDDGMGPLWIMRDSMGIVGIVRAQDWHDAYSIVEDELLPTVEATDIFEAYGFDSSAEFEARDTSKDDSMELAEGYSYQSNATGTGIVVRDLNGEALDPLTVELCERLQITICIKFGS